MNEITCEDAVLALKRVKTCQTAAYIAGVLGAAPRGGSPALRAAVLVPLRAD